MESLVMVSQDMEPYVVTWPSEEEEDGHLEFSVLVILKRPGGLLLAVPLGMLPNEDLNLAGSGADGSSMLGPFTEVEVPSVVLDGGAAAPTGDNCKVLIIDCDESIVSRMRTFRPFEYIVYGFDDEQPFALPDSVALRAAAKEWLEGFEEFQALNYVTADSGEEGIVVATPVASGKKAPKRKAKAKATGVPRLPGGGDDSGVKPKKPTTSSLHASMEVLLKQNSELSSQLRSLATKQQELENHVLAPVSASCPALSQPLSRAVQGPALAPSALTRHLQTPPRTSTSQTPGILHNPLTYQPPEVAALAMERSSSLPPQGGNPLAQAVYAQSQALTSLVAQLAQGATDPMLDLGGVSSTGTRGSTGRAKLQAELAAQRGTFFNAVLASMARRMNPTVPIEGSPQDMLQRGICGTRYLERFGGYGRHRDLGQLQWQVMQVFDFLQADNVMAARDAIALLAVTLEQACLDNGRFELAAVLCLQDDLPSSIYQNRQSGQFSRSRSFVPLADQRWITIALAYLKELDTIQTKRQELATPSKAAPASPATTANPKAKNNPKKKGKGKGNQQQQPQEEGEDA
eukprot:Skav202551  [mRNA]  locus=scaffold2011:393014:394735:- [translate_table: standard]